MDNQANILTQALALFAAHGYDAVGVRAICEACAVTKPTLYHYYGSKRGLLDAVYEAYYPAFILRMREAAEYRHDLVVNLEALASLFFRFAMEHPEFMRFALSSQFSPMQSEAHVAQERFRVEINAIMDHLFHLAVKDHGNMRGRERQMAMSFIGLLNGSIGLYLAQQADLDAAASRALVKQFMHGIFS